MLNSINSNFSAYLVQQNLTTKSQNTSFKGGEVEGRGVECDCDICKSAKAKALEQPTVKVALNGAGRISKNFLREWFLTDLGLGSGVSKVTSLDHVRRVKNSPAKLEIVAINDLADVTEEYLKHDSIMGDFPGKLEVKSEGDKKYLYVGEGAKQRKIRILKEKDATKLPWNELGVDVVVDGTGKFLSADKLVQHIEAGAKKAICSAPADEDEISKMPLVDRTVVYGVNDNELKPEDKYISAASCTTTCAAPLTKFLNDKFGIDTVLVQTVHSATSTQSTTDKVSDKAKDRNPFDAIFPEKTGAGKALKHVIPGLGKSADGIAARVPVSDVSLVNLVAYVKQDVTEEEVKQALKEASKSDEYKGLIIPSDKASTSKDMVGRYESAIYVPEYVKVINKRMVVIPAYYDNEWGYTRSLTDLTRLAGAQIYKPEVKGQAGNSLKISA